MRLIAYFLHNGLVQFSRPPDATNSTQQGSSAAAMRPDATTTVAAYYHLPRYRGLRCESGGCITRLHFKPTID